MKQYLELLQIPMARKLLIAATPARMAYSMISLSIFFKTERELNSITLAGIALGLNALAGSVTKLTRAYRDWETDRKSTRLNSSHRL